MTPTPEHLDECRYTPKIGDSIKDNDPRMPNRVLTVVEIRPFGVLAKDRFGKLFSILTRRIYADGKPRRSGFTFLPNGESP